MESKIPHQIDLCRNKTDKWIILVNGLFAGMDSWDAHINYLIRDYNVLRYDSLGQGNAPKLKEVFSLDEQVYYLKTLVESQNIENFVLLGISNGARVALKYAFDFPEKVNHVIAADTYDELNSDLELKIQSWLKASELGGNELRFSVSTPWIFGESLINERPELIGYFKEKAKESDQENACNLIKGALLRDKIDLANITVPVDFIVGDEDVLTTIKMHKKMHQKLPGSGLTIVKGGHASLLEYPENISEFVLPILDNKEYLNFEYY